MNMAVTSNTTVNTKQRKHDSECLLLIKPLSFPPASASLLLGLLLNPEDGGDMIFWKVGQVCLSQKVQIFIATAVIDINQTYFLKF
jgi:hypothetical protein